MNGKTKFSVDDIVKRDRDPESRLGVVHKVILRQAGCDENSYIVQFVGYTNVEDAFIQCRESSLLFASTVFEIEQRQVFRVTTRGVPREELL